MRNARENANFRQVKSLQSQRAKNRYLKKHGLELLEKMQNELREKFERSNGQELLREKSQEEKAIELLRVKLVRLGVLQKESQPAAPASVLQNSKVRRSWLLTTWYNAQPKLRYLMEIFGLS